MDKKCTTQALIQSLRACSPLCDTVSGCSKCVLYDSFGACEEALMLLAADELERLLRKAQDDALRADDVPPGCVHVIVPRPKHKEDCNG
jgi:hypothetical protein